MSTFVDQAHIFVKGGQGGNGVCSFRREKYVPRGGPDGGDGGNGGRVIAKATTRLSTLLDLRYQKHYTAENGQPGGGSRCHGRTGDDVVILVPVGTMIFDDDTQELLADLTSDGETCVIAQGGLGGRGNSHFATSTNRVPIHFEPGTPGEERSLRLELKLLADVGLVGYPNAGKSTLIAAVSSARPKIADYPFTTLTPNLAVVRWNEEQSFVIADIPGIIEGAHEGKGLGFQFLRHVERTSLLVHVIDISEWTPDDPVTSLDIMRHELTAYNDTLAARPFAVVGTKLDIAGTGERLKRLRAHCRRRAIPFFSISAATREGLDKFVQYLGQQVERLRNTPCETNS
ncbi:MAG: GTPase Obg [Nitrospirae bacterium]|nr:MAG: GTPase involved in DNA replication and ribosome assembly [Nitrospira sp. OLB3]MBV6468741.1 GTPase Obg [Nitrospirota bacterium]MCE7964074.1 GTPase ObgE [Nitrospira sp. NTP2]MCK6492735.1 GTPase ObgE [Nitrospira sp.]MEB2337076.1 GTPase ObgE [Nitrospirales bacterium]